MPEAEILSKKMNSWLRSRRGWIGTAMAGLMPLAFLFVHEL